MSNYKIRKRVPTKLVPILNRKEFNISFNTSTELSSFNLALDEAIVICNSTLPDNLKASTILNGGLKQYHIQPKVEEVKVLLLSDVIALYLAYSESNVTANEQRKRVLLLGTLPSMFTELHIPLEVDKVTARHMYLLSKHMEVLIPPRTKQIRLPQTVNREIKMIRGMVNYGAKVGLYFMPTIPTLKLSNSPIERTSLPDGTLTLIEPLLSSKAFLLLKVIYYSGMRNSEVTKATINNKDGVLCFDLTTQGLQLKTKSSARVIPIHSKLIPHITEIQSFTATTVKTLSRYINKALHTLYNNNSMYSLYSARHSVVTNLVKLGVPIEQIQSIVGHSSSNTMTIGTYFGGYELDTLRDVIELL